MIQLQGIRYSIGPRVLFDEVDWVLAPGDRCALVGPNGAGKTTLLRLILGELSPESGTRSVARGTRFGYLPQEAAERFGGSVLERALEAHRSVLAMREERDALHQRLEGIAPDDPTLHALLERAGELQHRLELDDEHALEPEARRVLSGLGFASRDQDRPLVEFSGGWRMRAALAALLLSDPTLLVMDEPTNHLDLPAMEWLEDYLGRFRGGLVVVSHDRVFLDRVAHEVKELDASRLTDYAMGFTDFLEAREQNREQIERTNAQVERRIAQLSRFVERFGAKNTKATQARSKKKMIARLQTQRVVLQRQPRGIRFQFPPPPHAGRTLVKVRDLAFGYGTPDLFAGVETEIERDAKVAIVGANGAGKTTLLRLIGGQLAPRLGTCDTFPHTHLAYFAQHAAETLDPKLTVLDALEGSAPPAWRPRLRSLLGSFLFSGDDVFKLCGVLSGGERQRVALALILLQPANLLLLDEPTHHLDLAGKEVLEDALDQYPGAVVVVTHDRSLMTRLATSVIEVTAGHVVHYPGGYADYEAARTSDAGTTAEAATVSVHPTGRNRPETTRPKTTRDDSHKQKAHNAKRDRQIHSIGAEIEAMEAEIADVEVLLADPQVYQEGARARELVTRYERLRAEVESLMQRLADL